jgi:hypothetical protein
LVGASRLKGSGPAPITSIGAAEPDRRGLDPAPEGSSALPSAAVGSGVYDGFGYSIRRAT